MLGPRDTLTSEARAALEQGVALFNEGRYHEALDCFEVPYHAKARRDGQLYLGLVQAAAALYHFTGGRWRSARRLYATSTEGLRAVVSVEQDVDVAALLKDLDRCFAPLMACADDRAESMRPAEQPRICRLAQA